MKSRRHMLLLSLPYAGLLSLDGVNLCAAKAIKARENNLLIGNWKLNADGTIRVLVQNRSESKFLLNLTQGQAPIQYVIWLKNGQRISAGGGLIFDKSMEKYDGWTLLWSGTQNRPASARADFELLGVSRRECLDMDVAKCSISILLSIVDLDEVCGRSAFPDIGDSIVKVDLKHSE
jgi:hypothetical protein